jgi:hypothetical protein
VAALPVVRVVQRHAELPVRQRVLESSL